MGRCPRLGVNKLLNQRAAIITIGMNDRNSTIILGKVNFFNKTNGKIRDSQVAIPQPIIVNIV